MRDQEVRAGSGGPGDAPADAARGAHGAPRARAAFRGALRAVSTIFAMAGWRLEHLNAAWVTGSVASVSLAHLLIQRADWRLTGPYFLFTLAFYYGANAAILRSDIPARAIARLGAALTFRTRAAGAVVGTHPAVRRWIDGVPVSSKAARSSSPRPE